MTTPPEHDEVAELLGAFVLDAVEHDEARRVEHHLAECPRCQAEADELFEVAAALGIEGGLEGDGPPAGLWERIAAGTKAGAEEPASQPPPGPAPARAQGLAPVGPPGRAGLGRPVPGRRWPARVVATAAAAAVVALAVGLVNSEGRVHELQSALADRGGIAAVRAALVTPGHQVVDLRAQGGAGVARLVVEPSGVGYVVTSSMPTLPSSETYQLWASIDGRAISLGLLGPRPRPGGAFNLGSAARTARELMVTVEPVAGVVAPDRAPVATARLHLD